MNYLYKCYFYLRMGSILGVIDVLLVFADLILEMLGNKERCEAITGSSL